MGRARLCRHHRDQLRSRIFGQASGIDVAVDRNHHSTTSAVLARFDSISNRLVVRPEKHVGACIELDRRQSSIDRNHSAVADDTHRRMIVARTIKVDHEPAIARQVRRCIEQDRQPLPRYQQRYDDQALPAVSPTR